MRSPIAGFNDKPMDMDTMVSTFINNLNPGVIRNELFRQYNSELTFDQAVEIGAREDLSHRQARVPSRQLQSSNDMDCNTIETNSIVCFRCGRQSHTRRSTC